MQQSQRRKQAACVHCRQMKLKCDSAERFPESCSRCAKSRLQCFVDPLFKRTSQRKRIELIEQELRSLKRGLNKSPEGEAAQLSPVSDHTPDEPALDDMETIASSSNAQQPTISARMLGDIWIAPETIWELLGVYYTHYHPLFPILPQMIPFVESHASFDVLFWAVIAIASSREVAHADLYLRLKPPVERMLGEINHSASHAFPRIQALLLICCWPFPFGPIESDLSWTYCGLATHYALRLGLHRPKCVTDFKYDLVYDQETMILRQKTWIGCFIVNQGISTKLGIPTTVKVDNSILEAVASSPRWLPDALGRQLLTAYQADRCSATLGNHHMTSTGLLPDPIPMIQMFEDDFRSAETRFESTRPPMELVMLLGAKISLYTFVLDAKDSAEAAYSSRRLDIDILSRAYSCVLQLLKVVVSPDAGVVYWTAPCQAYIYFGVFFLLKLLKYPLHTFVDEVAARNVLNRTWEVLKSCSVGEGDHISRICAMIQYLGTGEPQPSSGPTLLVKSRMGANIYRDAVWRAKKRFSMTVQEQRPEDYTTAEAILHNKPIDIWPDPYLQGILPDLAFLSGNFEW